MAVKAIGMATSQLPLVGGSNPSAATTPFTKLPQAPCNLSVIALFTWAYDADDDELVLPGGWAL